MPSRRAVLFGIAELVIYAAKATGKALVWHTVLFGTAIVAVTYLSIHQTSPWLGSTAIAIALIVHPIATAFILFNSAIVGVGHAVRRLQIASTILTAAVERAAVQNPRIRENNDYETATASLAAAFDSLANESRDFAPGRFRWIRTITARTIYRMIHVVGRVTLRQLELAPTAGQPAPFATLDEWLGSRIDAMAAQSLIAPARRVVIFTLMAQITVTAICIFGASRILSPPPNPAPSPPPATYP